MHVTKQHATKNLQWINDKIKDEIRKYFKTTDNGNTISQNL